MEALQKKWIVACVDGSKISEAVVDYAAWAAKKVGSPLELVHAIEHSQLLEHTSRSGNLTPNMQETLMDTLSEDEASESKRLIEEGKAMLAVAKAQISEPSAISEIATKQRHGALSVALKDLEDEIRILVLGVRGEAHDDDVSAIGGQLEETVRALHRPTLIVNGPFAEPKSMMLAINDTDGAQKALQMVAQSPLCREMDVHLVTVNDDVAKGESILATAAVVLEQAGFEPKRQVLMGDAQAGLMAYQADHNIDLIAMGAFSHGKLRNLFFGSFTLKMFKSAIKPILLLR
ncbi:universal stress protein [Thiomicrorhabdus sp. zzn3]|uniref:universal stress protein n=1 Tax=Thiomicrorhabdus sp. zzn3 TaxID=3039775 RepID=UPI00243740A3|nr:universal stress protein [Thiomicrorhabdus sp. zzn3]MDG6778978.1 universal stress protein [Thiomicrorhabdus sp. zzn3]